jgi:hypothetical protein
MWLRTNIDCSIGYNFISEASIVTSICIQEVMVVLSEFNGESLEECIRDLTVVPAP